MAITPTVREGKHFVGFYLDLRVLAKVDALVGDEKKFVDRGRAIRAMIKFCFENHPQEMNQDEPTPKTS